MVFVFALCFALFFLGDLDPLSTGLLSALLVPCTIRVFSLSMFGTEVDDILSLAAMLSI